MYTWRSPTARKYKGVVEPYHTSHRLQTRYLAALKPYAPILGIRRSLEPSGTLGGRDVYSLKYCNVVLKEGGCMGGWQCGARGARLAREGAHERTRQRSTPRFYFAGRVPQKIFNVRVK